jgi:hypothetical protein
LLDLMPLKAKLLELCDGYRNHQTSFRPFLIIQISHMQSTNVSILMNCLVIEFKELYNKLYPDEPSKTPYDEILEWITETDKLLKAHNLQKNDILDLILLAKIQSKVCGFFLLTHYYHSRSFAFISFLGVDLDNVFYCKDNDIHKNLNSTSLKLYNHCDKLMHDLLFQCRGIIAESDERKKISSFNIRLLSKGKYKLWKLDNATYKVSYLQPNPIHKQPLEGNEIPMTLLYIRTEYNLKYEHNNEPPDEKEIYDILDFTYNTIYGDSCLYNEALDKIYRPYTRKLFESVWSEYKRLQTK